MAATQKGRSSKQRSAKNITKEQLSLGEEIFLLLMLAVSVLLFLSGFGIGGRLTNSISEALFGLFGFMAYIFPVLFFMCVFFIVAGENASKMVFKTCASIAAYLTLCIFCQVLLRPEDNLFQINAISAYYSHSKIFKQGGGVTGGIVYYWLEGMFGRLGSGILCVFLLLLCFVVMTRKSIFKGIHSLADFSKRSPKSDAQRKKEADQRRKQQQQKKAVREKRRHDDYVFRQKEKEIAYRAKQERRKQYLEDLETKRKEEAAANRLRRQEEEKRRQEALQRQKSKDAVFTVTDLKHAQGSSADALSGRQARRTADPAPSSDRQARKAADLTPSSGRRARRTADPALSSDIHVQNEVDTADTAPMQEFTITRGGKVQMYDLADTTHGAKEETAKPKKKTAESVIMDSNLSAEELMQAEAAKSEQTTEKVTKEEAKKALGEVSKEIASADQMPKPEVYKLPPLSLLQRGKAGAMGDSDEVLRETALKLQQTLKSFGVNVTVLDVSCGPAVTRYELQPEIGVKVSRIVSLADDIKLNLAVSDIRIEAPIPGKPAVGIEVPNTKKSPVFLRELLESEELKKQKSLLAFPAGKDIAGKVIVADLAKMPHMLVAGTTGSGKSVFTNTIILSMLYRAKPHEVRFIIIDPKVVEFGVYNGIPHLMIPVVTDPKKAAGALNWAVAEMAERYKKFADMHVRDINGYNAKIDAMEATPPKEGEIRPQRLPKIVIIIDELADLMMVAAKEVEDAICRLAQLARAAGIHMIIATQRPSVDVVTGLIKANIPSRVALTVASGTDSRTILDMNGAEKLLGNGDMLFYPNGMPKPIRVQGAFVTDEEVGSIVDYLKAQNQGGGYDRSVEEKVNQMQASGSASAAADGGGEYDEYFADAGKFIIEKDKASIGMLQRVFKIGFNRAARIMDQLSDAGVVGPEEGTKPRKILMSMTDFENLLEEIN